MAPVRCQGAVALDPRQLPCRDYLSPRHNYSGHVVARCLHKSIKRASPDTYCLTNLQLQPRAKLSKSLVSYARSMNDHVA